MTNDETGKPRRREPQIVAGRSGTRMFSINALLERIEDEFRIEYGESSDALREADTPIKRLKLLRDVVEYVLGVESVRLDNDAKADLIGRAYSNLFGYGPLDALFADERVTTIALLGANHASARYGHAELTTLPPLFEDDAHLRRIIGRLLLDAGAEWDDEMPIIETGLTIGDRPISISIVAPPISHVINVDIRLHPRQAPTLDDLAANGFMTPETAAWLKTLAASKYGIAIVGDAETGKTTLLNALLPYIPAGKLASVERAGELRLPPGAARFVPRWAGEGRASFGEQIGAALSSAPDVLLLDEVRADEPTTIAQPLQMDAPPRLIWAVRGVPDAKRLQSAMGMLARRAAVGQGEALVHALYDRLPFVLTVARIQESLRLFSVAEWQSRVDSDYPDYVMLRRYENGAARPTDNPTARWV